MAPAVGAECMNPVNSAIEVLLKHLDADRADTLAFGDAKVDIPMLDYCQVGILNFLGSSNR